MTRSYHFDVTDETVAALRHLRNSWRGWRHEQDAFLVTLESGTTLRLAIERSEIAPGFEARWLRADLVEAAVDPVASSFESGRNDVVIFSSEFWADERGSITDGPPGCSPETAVIASTATDALLLENPAGDHMLVRCSAAGLEIMHEIEAIREFARARGYSM
jgi:hypothetical protein